MTGEAQILRTVFFAVAAPASLVAALSFGRPYMVPIAVAVLIWFLINAMADGLRDAAPRMPAWLATTLSLLILFGAITGTVQVVANSVGGLAIGLSGVDEQIVALLNKVFAGLGFERRLDLDAILRGLRLEALAFQALGAVRSLASDVSLVFLYVMFLLVDQRFYLAKLHALYPDAERRHAIRATLRHIADEVRAYLWLMTLLSGGVALSTYLLCAAFGVTGAAFWGFAAFGLNFIPVIGSILAVVFPSVYALVQFENDLAFIALAVLLSAVQFVAGEIVLPRLMGDRLNLSTFVILLSLVVWGAIWGPAGMFLAIPIMVILMIVFSQFPATRPIAITLSRTGGLTERRPVE
jgi:predicted PurR-regulated permease PerM